MVWRPPREAAEDRNPAERTQSMAGAMRKMAVYLGLVEDDGYDGPGFDPDDEFEPEMTAPPAARAAEPEQRSRGASTVTVAEPAPAAAGRTGRASCTPRRPANRGSPPWHPSHPNATAWRRTHR